jgi:hypothetical protein
MNDTSPSDFVPLKGWHLEYGTPVFTSPKMLHYFIHPLEQELMQAGALARVGVQIFLHKTRFWPEYQRIIANQMRGDQ